MRQDAIAVVGVSHWSAPLAERERFAFGPAVARRLLHTRDGERLLLVTCNRTELYGVAPTEELREELLEAAGVPEARLDARSGERAVSHLFAVASGLDSMVALYTGCQAFRPFEYQPGQLFYGQPAARSMDEELMAILELRRPQYLVQLPMPEFAEERPFAKAVAELRSSHPEWLSVAYQDPEPGFVIYKVHPPQPQAAVVQSQ